MPREFRTDVQGKARPGMNIRSQHMSDTTLLQPALSSGARWLMDAAEKLQRAGAHPEVCVNHWLLAVVQRHGSMAESLAPRLEAKSLVPRLHTQLTQGQTGDPLPRDTILTQAGEWATTRGKSEIAERDIVAAVLNICGYEVARPDAPPAKSVGQQTPAGQPPDPSATVPPQGNRTKSPPVASC
ncbi:MAG: hypothetical protein CO095_19585 [Armatimonadetes bacterium CG_4_9_14_3_um_filter_58_7]|nr:MAG: hypothetical protein CO095_19585 [Armatimonadetes bacterium CG_4_9_14_3_um_filter_58_7]